MAEKSFGIKELNLIGASGTPSIDSPNNLNLNAVNVAISTNVSIGGTLSVTGNVSIGGTLTYEDVTNIDSVGIITARNGIDCNGDLDVDGHTELDNTNIVGLVTVTNTSSGIGLKLIDASSKQFVAGGGGGGTPFAGSFTGHDFRIQVGGLQNAIFKYAAGATGNLELGPSSGIGITFNGSTGNAGYAGIITATTFSGSGASLTSLPAANLTGTLPAISGANLTNLPADTPTNSDIQVVYTVTANGSSAYRFAGNGVVSTADNPDLYLIRGQKYRFINNSGGSHPFQIREASGGTAYSTGVTNNGAASGNIDFAPTYDSPAQLVYQCTAHGGMVGNIYLRDAAGNNTNVGVTTFSGASTFTGISDHSSRIQMLAGNAVRFLNAANSASTEIKCDGGARLNITSYNQTMATFENGQSIIFYTDSGQNRLQIANNGNISIARDLDVDGHTNLDNVSISGITTIASGSYVNSASPYRVAGHPVLGYDNFTDISGGSYATRLGSTGTSTLRSTQIYGGGNHIATFDGVNYRLGIKTTTPIGTLDVYDGTFVLSKPNASGGERNWRFVNNNVAAGNLGLQVSTAAGGSTFSNLIEITRDGKVGINEGSPDYMLHLSGSVPAICFEDTDGTHGQAIIEQNGDNLKIRQDAGNASSGTGSNIRFEVDGSEKLRITSTGIIDAPSQAGFYARMQNTKSSVMGGGASYYTVPFDTDSGSICYDQHNSYNTSTGLYTVPTNGTGYYMLATAVCLSNNVYGRGGEFWFIQGSNRYFFDRRFMTNAGSGTITGFYGTSIIYLSAGQSIGVQGFISGGSTDVDVQGAAATDQITWFTARKIA